ncbi:MAG: hypothetical protein C5B54_01700 [Acidobacteria bacterium]|nr:MAG: hypothetical protein C5B54_01700 [Acidobacteriota bacterium]
MNTDELKLKAVEFLTEEFNHEVPNELMLEATFNAHPLNEQGLSALFSFHTSEKFFVFVGNVMPMVYPDLNLSNDELWAVHIGMEYFVKANVIEDTERKPAALLAYLKMVGTVFQEQLYIMKPDSVKVEKVYQLENQKHVVGKATFEDKSYCWIVGDITHFVYKKDLPPQIVWALHMGRLLLA